MSFKYMNPGFAEWLDTAAGTTVKGDQYNRYGGVAFWNSQDKVDVRLPEMPGKHLYIKASLWLNPEPTGRGYFEVSTTDSTGKKSTGFGGWLSYGTWYFYRYHKTSYSELSKLTCVRYGALNDVLIHINKDTTGAPIVTINLNGTVIYNDYDWDSDIYGYAKLRSEVADVLLSNIIISDRPIEMKERVVPLAVTATETDLPTDDEGNYVTTEADKMVLYTLDAGDILERFGEDSKITGIGFACVPGYSTGDAVTRLIGIRKPQDGEVEELGSSLLSTAKDGKTVVGAAMDISFAELQGSQFGMKTGA